MITEDYVFFETAKLLKEKGLVSECIVEDVYYVPTLFNIAKCIGEYV